MLGYIQRASEVPDDAIPAYTTIPANGHYSLPMPIYVREEYKCRDCGARVEWTAQEKYDYFEVQNGNRYARRVRCDDCYGKTT